MRTCLLACVILLVTATAAFPAVTSESFAGDWEGTLEAFNLRVVLHLQNVGGKWAATMDSPDQGGYGDKCDEVSIDGTKLYLALDAFNVEFDGTLSKDGNQIEGIFTQHGNRLPLTLVRTDGAPKPPVAPVTSDPHPFAGDWAGTLDAGMKFRLVVHLVLKDGVWSGSMDSLDQGANGIPISTVAIEDRKKLRFEITAIKGVYEGTMSDDGKSIKGTWSQSGASLPLDLARGDASSMPEPKRPQEPKPPFPYRSEDVTVPGPGGISLAGTFTAPTGNGPFPAVVLITGSGAQDRDERLAGHKPFLVLSDHLTRQGIAVLRCDDRGFGKSTGNAEVATTEDFVQDALAEVAFLKARKDVDATQIGLVGHSEGGIIAPISAVRSKDVAFVVMMAGVGVHMSDLLVRQISDLVRAGGAGDAVVNHSATAVRRMCQIAGSTTDTTLVHRQLDAVADSLAAQLSAIDPARNEVYSQQAHGLGKLVGSTWFRYILTLEPAETLRQVKQPVLAINGSLDLQVSAKANLPVIEKALKDGGNKDVTVQELPGLNHLFQTATNGSPMEYAAIEETMSPAAMKVISDWLLARTGGKKK